MIHLKVLVSEVVYPVKIRYEPIYVRGLFLHLSEYIKKRGFLCFQKIQKETSDILIRFLLVQFYVYFFKREKKYIYYQINKFVTPRKHRWTVTMTTNI